MCNCLPPLLLLTPLLARTIPPLAWLGLSLLTQPPLLLQKLLQLLVQQLLLPRVFWLC